MKIIAHDGMNTIAKDLQNGDRLAVGGSIFSDKATTHVECDFDQFSDLFVTYNFAVNKLDKNAVGTWLQDSKIPMDQNLYSHCAAFDAAVHKHYPDFLSNISQRGCLYKDGNTLSHLMKNGLAACSEISVLATKALQDSGYDAEIVVGEYFADKNSDMSDMHSFVVIKSDDKINIYNPIRREKHHETLLPNLYEISPQQYDEMVTGMQKGIFQCFLESKSIYCDNAEYFGYGCRGGNVNNFIVERNKTI